MTFCIAVRALCFLAVPVYLQKVAFLIFEVIMYIVGVIWFMTVYAAQTGPVGLATVMGWCVIPFIIPDIVKMVVAVLIGERASKLTKF